jgi:hypothetical protein
MSEAWQLIKLTALEFLAVLDEFAVRTG